MHSNKKIGLLGGSFDPVHLGHLHVAKSVMDALKLDNIIFIPARQNPLKTNTSCASDIDRLAMVHLAVDGVPGWSVDDRELRRDAPSYTITTVAELVNESKHAGKHDEYFLIIGEDSAQSFYKWYKNEEIVELVKIVVVRRPGYPQHEYQGDVKVVNSLLSGRVTITPTEISSTDVRERLTKGLSCDSIIPIKVLDYIKAHGLYSKPMKSEGSWLS